MMEKSFDMMKGPGGLLAYAYRPGRTDAPGVLWLGGFRSDMTGTKASFIDQWAADRGRAYIRFDYSGHGASEGAFENGSVGDWKADALAILDHFPVGPLILVGSSMGAWIAALLALARPDRIAALVLIAPAPDFTERLMWPSFSALQRQKLMEEDRIELPSAYSPEADIITRKLIEDGRRHLVMTGPVPIHKPVRILQGMADDVVPYQHALAFADLLESPDVEVLLTPAGDHRLSSPADLGRLARALDGL